MTHRAPEPEVTETPVVPLRRRMFQEKYAPHIGFAVVTLLYIAFYIASGITTGDYTGAAVPQTISLAWTGNMAAWFGYLIRQRASYDKAKGEE
jgi:hypothetical protein